MSSAELTKMVRVEGWGLVIEADEEPTIEDVELAAKLGFRRERDIRKLVERLRAEGLLKNSDVRATVARQVVGGWGGHRKPVATYRLTEAGALKVIARSETRVANAILDQVIAVFVAYRRGQLPAAAAPVLATGVTVGDNALARADMAAWCTMTSRTLGIGLPRVHGAVRRNFLVPGVYHVPLALWPVAREFLEALAMRRLILPSARLLLAQGSDRQLALFRRSEAP